MQKRPNAVTFKGNPVTLVGPQLKAGDKAPDFEGLVGLDKTTLAQTPAKARIFSVVPSLDTAVCSMQTHKFDEALGALGDKIASDSHTVVTSICTVSSAEPLLHCRTHQEHADDLRRA